MLAEPRDSSLLYRHYCQFPGWLPENVRERSAGAMRCVHRITAALQVLHFPENSVPLDEFEESTGLAELLDQGCDLRSDALYVLDSAVHGLPGVWKELEFYRDEHRAAPPLPYRNDYACVPDVRPLFDEAEVPLEWMRFLRRLVREFTDVDRMIRSIGTKVDIELHEMACLCFHACLLAGALYQAMSILAFARAHQPAEERLMTWTTNYYHYDGLGSTRQLTDANGNVTDSYTYRAYGELSAVSGTTVNPFRWVGRQGYYYDSDPHEYYVRARHYSPGLARWLSWDPIKAGLSIYRYCGNAPIILCDASGLLCVAENVGFRYRVPVAALDAFSVNKDFSALARIVRLVLQERADKLPGKTQIPDLITTGLYGISNDKKNRIVAFFFFYVDWDICETFDTDCELWVDEAGSKTVFHDGVTSEPKPGFVQHTADVKKGPRKPPLQSGPVILDKKLIFADAPVFDARKKTFGRGWVGFDAKVKQAFEIRDRSRAGAVVTSASHELTFHVDDDGNVG